MLRHGFRPQTAGLVRIPAVIADQVRTLGRDVLRELGDKVQRSKHLEVPLHAGLQQIPLRIGKRRTLVLLRLVDHFATLGHLHQPRETERAARHVLHQPPDARLVVGRKMHRLIDVKAAVSCGQAPAAAPSWSTRTRTSGTSRRRAGPTTYGAPLRKAGAAEPVGTPSSYNLTITQPAGNPASGFYNNPSNPPTATPASNPLIPPQFQAALNGSSNVPPPVPPSPPPHAPPSALQQFGSDYMFFFNNPSKMDKVSYAISRVAWGTARGLPAELAAGLATGGAAGAFMADTLGFGCGFVADTAAGMVAAPVAKAVGNYLGSFGGADVGAFAGGVAEALAGFLAGGPCFAAGTQVVVGVNADGSYATKDIQDIQVGDYVLSRPQNDPTAPLQMERVTAVYVHQVSQEQLLTVRDAAGQTETITCTAEHPFWVPGEGWVPAGGLAAGAELTSPDGSAVVVVSNVVQVLAKPVNVYNFQVANDHTYFVDDGAEPVWVHNTCSEPFKVNNWSGYPKGIPKPKGSSNSWKERSIRRREKLANAANKALHRADKSLRRASDS